MVQFWCSFSAVLVPSVVHKYLNTCTQVPISTQVSKYNAVLVQFGDFYSFANTYLVQFWCRFGDFYSFANVNSLQMNMCV